MESSGVCKSCRKRCLVRDDTSSYVVCSSCGIVQDFDDYQAPIGGFSGPEGTFIRVGTSGIGGKLNYREKKNFEAGKTIDDILRRLGLSVSTSNEVKQMLERITEGEFSLGDWFPVLIGACSYVVMRNGNKSLPLAEVAPVIQCDTFELGRMVARVVDFLNLKLPEFDIVKTFERAIQSCPTFTRVSADKMEAMLKQGTFLMQCAMKWFLTTGRRPLPMVAAVLSFVAELNQVDAHIEDVAKEVHAMVSTSKKRYKELVDALIGVGKALPWGKDITAKNIMKNAPFVLQYMEIRSRGEKKKRNTYLGGAGFCLEDVMGDYLKDVPEYDIDNNVIKSNSLPSETKNMNCGTASDSVCSDSSWIFNDPKQLRVWHECWMKSYSRLMNESSRVREGGGGDCGRKRKNACGLSVPEQRWSGKSPLCTKLFWEQILEVDVGLDLQPLAFVNGCLSEERRRAKIMAAKLRIDKVMNPPKDDDDDDGKKVKANGMDIDWEDVIIETLLIHSVKEEEILKGNYKALMGLHVFNSGMD